MLCGESLSFDSCPFDATPVIVMPDIWSAGRPAISFRPPAEPGVVQSSAHVYAFDLHDSHRICRLWNLVGSRGVKEPVLDIYHVIHVL